MEIRAAAPADAEAIERIRVRGWQVAYRHLFPAEFLDTMEVDPSRWQERIAEPPRGWSFFVATRDERVIGFAIVGPSRDEPDVGELYALYVDPDCWSAGLGSALIRSAEARLAEEYAEATLWVLQDNPRARRAYERADWQVDGASKRFEAGGVAPLAIRYRKRLSSSASRS